MVRKSLLKRILFILSPIILAFILLIIFFLNPGLVNNIAVAVLVVLFIAIFVLFFIAYFVLRNYLNGLQQITNHVKKLSEGDLEALGDIDSSKENDFNEINSFLIKTSNFFKDRYQYLSSITLNKIEEEFKPENEKDILGNKLVELAENLKKNKAEIEKAKIEEDERNWIANGLAKFSDILRLDTHDIRKLGSSLMSNLVNYIDANQGALYVLSDNEEDENGEPTYEMVAAIAYNREKLLKVKIGLGEGLVGHCAYERKKIFLTEIPQDYINIGSGLGTANPNCILIVPCMIDEKVYGIIELATFNNIPEYQIGFIEKLGESIASTISNVQINEKTKYLLEESKKQGEELAAQEEELRQNLEEMEATQEDLERQMKANAIIRQEIAQEKFLFDTLLEQIPARIFFKDDECKFIKASTTAAKKFGKESYHELVGLSDADLLDPEFAKKTMEDERQIMHSRQGKINFVEHEKLNDGSEIWKTVSKIPLIDKEDKCVGTFGIINDITEFKLLEIQSNKVIENFDALTSNIKQYFISLTFSLEGFVEEVNDHFCELFSMKSKDIIGKNFREVLDSKQNSGIKIADVWQNILDSEKIVLENEYKLKRTTFKLVEIFTLIIDDNEKNNKVLMIASKSS